MVNKGGLALKSLQTLLRIIQFLAALLILGIFGYFLARLAANDLPKAGSVVAVTIIAAIAVVYLLFTILLTFFLGGKTGFGALAILFDLLLLGGMIAIAVLTREGRNRCSGFERTPLGRGNIPATQSDISARFGFGDRASPNYRPSIRRACRLNRAVFIVSLILIGLFLISAILQMLLVRSHKKAKRYGPSPSTDYTTGTTKKRGLFARKTQPNYTRDAELATAGAATTGVVTEKPANTIRPSHETGYTGSTVASPDPYGVNKYNNTGAATQAAPIATNPGFTGPPPHGTGPLHNYAGTSTTSY